MWRPTVSRAAASNREKRRAVGLVKAWPRESNRVRAGRFSCMVEVDELSSNGSCLACLLLPALASLGFGEALSLPFGYTGHVRLLVGNTGSVTSP